MDPIFFASQQQQYLGNPDIPQELPFVSHPLSFSPSEPYSFALGKKIVYLGLFLTGLAIQIKRLICERHLGPLSILFNRAPVHDTLLVKPTDESANWVCSVLTHYGIVGGDVSGIVIPLKLSPEQIHYYCDLQKKITELIPEEEYRPTIDLEISGEKAANKKESDCAIVGGLGPLSDSEILKQVIEKIKSKGDDLGMLKIRLFSAPPPRKLSHRLVALPRYLVNLSAFLHEKHKNTYIASNTAHLNFNAISMLSANPIYHLVHHVVKHVDAQKKVFVLGTTPAWQKKLYPQLFKKAGVSCIEIENEEKQRQIQAVIDETKQGKKIDHLAQQLFTEIQEHHRKHNWSHLLLGCTELPIALHDYKKALEESGITILDSEELFSSAIAEKLRT